MSSLRMNQPKYLKQKKSNIIVNYYHTFLVSFFKLNYFFKIIHFSLIINFHLNFIFIGLPLYSIDNFNFYSTEFCQNFNNLRIQIIFFHYLKYDLPRNWIYSLFYPLHQNYIISFLLWFIYYKFFIIVYFHEYHFIKYLFIVKLLYLHSQNETSKRVSLIPKIQEIKSNYFQLDFHQQNYLYHRYQNCLYWTL